MYYTYTAVCCDNLYIKTLIHKLRNCLLTFRVFRDDCSSEASPHINQGVGGEARVGQVSFLILGMSRLLFHFSPSKFVGWYCRSTKFIFFSLKGG